MDIRALHEDDLDLICRHREEMFRDAGRGDDVLLPMTAHFREWLKPRLRDGDYFGFMMVDHGAVIAGIGLMLIDWPPHPLHPAQHKRGYVLNVFVEPAYRQRGLARELMKLAEAAFIGRGVGYAVLHATDKGKPLYQRLGWTGTSEMAKTLDIASACAN
ncbi:MAG TPA: GNAT family N-acetyltransferase [Dyella sp.]|uniref:GNAT family N-acetyltransferase n=1 Tax=Dyella sp. TaxID=1869338 RepID=UPI002D0397E4|nr:GNAT family N-acetyltransferase [Dyella sp.]HTV85021.1 GNAT family N-acetyltransferase [Dyella sp.]